MKLTSLWHSAQPVTGALEEKMFVPPQLLANSGSFRSAFLAGVAAILLATPGCSAQTIDQIPPPPGSPAIPPPQPPPPPPTPGQVTALITVNVANRFQQISGWEATAQAGEAEPGFANWQAPLMDLAANDLGINRIRLELYSGSENSVDYYAQFRAGTISESDWNSHRYTWVNDNSNSNLINASGFKWTSLDESLEATVVPMRSRLALRGEALYVNLNYVSFGNSTAHQNPAEYAEFMLATFQHIQSRYGFVPNAIEVILEPENTIWRGTSIGQLIATTGARLAAAGFHPEFIAPSVTNMANAVPYLDQIVAVPGALTYLKEVAYHRYAGVSDANLAAIKSRASQHGLRTSMLEHIGSDVEDLYKDLTIANVSAWQQFTLAYPAPDNGGHYYGISNGQPVIGSRTVPLRQYFHFVRSGAYRVGATSDTPRVRPVAFTNPGGGAVLVLHLERGEVLAVNGLPAGRYFVAALPAASGLIPATDVPAGGQLVFTMELPSIVTVYQAP